MRVVNVCACVVFYALAFEIKNIKKIEDTERLILTYLLL